MQGYDFSIEYNKEEELAVPDALSMLPEKEGKTALGNEVTNEIAENEERSAKRQIRGKRIKDGKLKVHLIEQEGKKWWRHDDGKKVVMPEEHEKKSWIDKAHESLAHRRSKAVHYYMKKTSYWQWMKRDIEERLKECIVCKINNRKNTGGSEFVVTTRMLEKVALELIDIRE